MKELSLFTGVGGGILGTNQIGLTPVCGVEIDPYCRDILKIRQDEGTIPKFPIYDDVKKFDGDQWSDHTDIVTGGFPCQRFSTAAHGMNNAEDLWPEMLRVVNQCNPEYVFAENVTKKAIQKAGEDLVKMGYKAEAIPLSAKDLGADHVRRRYWLLAYSDNKEKLRSAINAKTRGLPRVRESIWEAGPNQSGVVNGVSRRVDRDKATGNGQVPVVAAAALWTLAFA
jgi:DNA (cytosine-5)-methyltransferase 1